MILGTGTKVESVAKLSQKVSKAIYSSNQEDLLSNLMKIRGMGQGKALSVIAALELGRRKNSFHNAKIKHPSDLIPFIRNYSMEKREFFLVVTLNGSHEIIQIRIASMGTADKAMIHPREIFSEAMKENASGIIICHNHPSGNCNPSKDDIETTRQIINASHIIGIELLDHIIFTQNEYYSFVEHDLLFNDEPD